VAGRTAAFTSSARIRAAQRAKYGMKSTGEVMHAVSAGSGFGFRTLGLEWPT